MTRFSTCRLARTWALTSMLGLGWMANAQAVVLDFESLPLNAVVSSQFAGVVFSSPGNPTQPEINTFSGNSTTGQVLADFSIVGGLQLDANFTAPVTSVFSLVYANPNFMVTARAYDAANTLLGTATSAGGTYNQGVLGFSGLGLISKVTWDTGSATAAVGIDDLRFSPAVPEPGVWGMLAAAALVLPVLKRRRKAAV
jgi:hypothetical protein